MNLIILLIVLIISLVVLLWLLSLLIALCTGAPVVYSNNKSIIDAMNLAQAQPNQMLLDLGCGNARSLIIASKKFHTKGIGVERSVYFFLLSRLNVWLSGESKNIKIILGDFKQVDRYLSQVDIVYMYLLPSVMDSIKKWLFDKLKKDAKIVSLSFCFSDIDPVRIIPTNNLGQNTKILLYKI